MASPEIIDFFSNENVEPSILNKDFSAINEEENKEIKSNPKRSSNSINYSDNDENTSMNDKVVWVTAIFVFFGIMVFLLGYWLGKTSIKQLFLSEKEAIAEKEKKLEEKKLENFVLAPSNSSIDTPIIIQSAPIQEKIVEPKVKIPEIKVEKPQRQESTATSASVSKNLSFPEKVEKKEKIRREETKEEIKKSSPSLKKETPVEGKYSIQVSAHTSMEKARAVEEELRNFGVYSYLVEANVNGITYYRVRVGKFSTKEEAENTLKKVKSSRFGRDSFIINLN